MKKKLRKLLNILLLAALILSVGMLLRQLRDNQKGSQSYSAAEQLASAPQAETEAIEETVPTESTQPAETVWVPEEVADDPEMEDLRDINLAALREVNPDVVGWIRVPGTAIDYPLMQGEDNDFYLNHTWEGESNSVGSLFLEYQCSGDLTDFHSIIYGHNMGDGSMFGRLKRYAKQDYWEKYPYVYLVTDGGVYRYEIFSAYKADVEGDAYAVRVRTEERKEAVIALALESSVIETGITPAVTDRILTRSTCSGETYANRWVVQARLKMVEA